MAIKFNMLLEDAGFILSDVRLLRHKDNSSEKGLSPYELWRFKQPLFNQYQSTQHINNETRLTAPFWASFVGTPFKETMFVGIYKVAKKKLMIKNTPTPHRDGVDLKGTCHIYELSLDNRLSEYIGRIIIDWGEGDRAWIQRPDNQNKDVIELRATFKDPDFPGFLNFFEPLSKIDSLPDTWLTPLKSTRGIYLLTCPKTKEQYVGSATGEFGFWGRWQEYVKTGHGGNIFLKTRDPSDYQVSILEAAGTATTWEEILAKESLWKAKLQTREMGLNGN